MFYESFRIENMKNYSKKQSHGWVLQSHMATTVLLLDACFKVNVIDDDDDDDDDVETIYNGAKLFKDISIIRLFANIVDSDGKQLFLMPGEETESPAPNLKVFELQDKQVNVRGIIFSQHFHHSINPHTFSNKQD